MDGKFTYADKNDPEWVHEVFDTKEEALEEGSKTYENGFLVGQLKSNGVNYKIENVYEFNEMTLDA